MSESRVTIAERTHTNVEKTMPSTRLVTGFSLYGMVHVMAAFTDFVVHAGACEQYKSEFLSLAVVLTNHTSTHQRFSQKTLTSVGLRRRSLSLLRS